jgi:protoporphyrinogen oxidase
VIVIVGAGPTGLGAAWRLHELGRHDFMVIEAESAPGGLAASAVDAEGFTWDLGGHVQFSHYDYYDEVLDRAVTCGWLEHERQAWVWIRDRWVPYPFQYNLHRLADGDGARALRDLETAAAGEPAAAAAHYGEWVDRQFGRTLAEIFMVPYNRKVWGYPLEMLDVGWMGERVAPVDPARLRRNLAEARDDVSWGPNNRFRFPLRGGTGAIWTHVAAALPKDRLRFDCPVDAFDLTRRRVRTADGDEIACEAVVSSMPLDLLCTRAAGLDPSARAAAAALVHSSVHVLGVGLRGVQPEALRGKCWMYFPESHSPYYRVTVFSNYSPGNVPGDGECWSLMAEVCESPHKPVDRETLIDDTVRAMRRDALIPPSTDVVSLWHRRLEHGYPTPFLGRDDVLGRVLPALEACGVYSRGRFGAWKYEVSNQDHSFMQGVEAVERILGIGDEPTLRHPHAVNRGDYRHMPSRTHASPAGTTLLADEP